VKKVLVANRGEIAVRVFRAAQELGLQTVAVYSDADEHSQHVRIADSAVNIGPAAAIKSYLNVDAVIRAAVESGADAIHPGYGFLSERAAFAERVEKAGLIWVGPSASAIEQMGDKAQAIAVAKQAGVPTIPGSDGPIEDPAAAIKVARAAGFPIAIKAAAGGGGRGIRIVASETELAEQLPIARAEAQAAFGDGSVYLERMVQGAKHIEVQVFGDGKHFVHLGERECSVQRRRQKLIEETPAPQLPADVRSAMCASAVALAQAVNYQGAGTVEFLYEQATGQHFFIEMNTRIQVEHPITEAVTGIDLVAEQLLVASGMPLSFTQTDVQSRGHAIEVRLNAEDPEMQFMPSPGHLDVFAMPAGPFVRVDSGFATGDTVSPFYDSLLGKIIVWGQDREEATTRMLRALRELQVEGVKTTAGFLASVLRSPEFISGDYDTLFLERWQVA
jgi:acetyl-CoA carboxylase biotin carboxylase subunit